MNEKLLKDYNENGYCIASLYDEQNHDTIIKYTKEWVTSVLKNNASEKFNSREFEALDLQEYHLWQQRTKFEHDGIFGAKNRYIDPISDIKKLILNLIH